MRYDNLQSLLQGSDSARSFFLTLPVAHQLTLHRQFDPHIHTAAELHLQASRLETYQRQVEVSEALGHRRRKG